MDFFYYLLIWQQLVAKLVNDEEQQPVATISEDVFFSIPWGLTFTSYLNVRMLIV